MPPEFYADATRKLRQLADDMLEVLDQGAVVSPFQVPEPERCGAQLAGSGERARVFLCSLVGGHDLAGHGIHAQPHRCHAGHDLRHRIIATWGAALLLLFVLAATPAEAKWCSKKHPKPGCPPAATLFLR